MITDDGSVALGGEIDARTVRREPRLRVALEFRAVEFLEDLVGGLVEQTPAVGSDTTTLTLGGLDEVFLLELLEDGPDEVLRAVGSLRGRDLIAVRAALRAAVLRRESLDADRAAVGDLAQEAGRAGGPEVVLLGRQFVGDAALGEFAPVRFLESVREIVGERLDEVVRRNVVHRSHWRVISVRGI